MKTIIDVTTNTLEIKKSKFICTLFPISSEEEAKEILINVRKEHPKANHHCSALILDHILRSNDDGEPASTAGLPMLETLMGNDMNRVLAVVVRYFGGTLLGKGGLIRAYSSSVSEAIKVATLYEPKIIQRWQVTLPFHWMSVIETKLEDQAVIKDRDYTDQAVFKLDVYDDALKDRLIELTNGQIEFKDLGSFEELVAVTD